MDRRRFIASGAALLGAGLAGCTSSGDSTTTQPTEGGGAEETPVTTETATDSPTATPTATETTQTATATDSGPYSVTMAPVGEVTFEEVPRTWVANNGSWADMGVALGREPPEGVWLPSRYHTHFYDNVPGVDVDTKGMTKLWGSGGPSKETIISLDGDVHVMDPNFLLNRSKNWERSDVQDVTERVAPMFGNTIFSRGYPWHEDYRYYSLYEAFGKLAKVFKREARYEAFVDLHEGFQASVQSIVPAKSERPDVAVLWAGNEPEQFYPYIIGKGTSFKHLRDLKVGDALARTDVKNFHKSRAAINYETLIKVDPDVILLRGHEGQSADKFQSKVVDYMKDHSTASTLTAVQNGDIYRNVPLYQGPIINLVVTERLAGDLYGADEELFDRQRVADIVGGDL